MPNVVAVIPDGGRSGAENHISLKTLSPGQTDRQAVASGRKLNLRRDLRWVAKRTGKFPRKYTRLAKKPILRQTYPVFHWLIIRQWTSLNLR